MSSKGGKLIILVGVSGSGKSTYARELQASTKNSVIVGRDPIRTMLFNLSDEGHSDYYKMPDLREREKEVTLAEEASIYNFLRAGKTVIVDNTHLKIEYLTAYHKYRVPVEYVLVEEDLFTCLTRDKMRSRKVGDEVIKSQYANLYHLKKKFDFSPYSPEPMQSAKMPIDPNKQNCVIFDIDGTLALMDGRSPFDWSRVGEDKINPSVYEMYQILSYAQEIFELKLMIVSGRDGKCMQETKEWLKKHSINYDRIYLREIGDTRKDSLIKEEIWKDIEKEYNILCMFDDRNQVVDHARSLGYSVFQVAEGNF
jgi:predicted kinase